MEEIKLKEIDLSTLQKLQSQGTQSTIILMEVYVINF